MLHLFVKSIVYVLNLVTRLSQKNTICFRIWLTVTFEDVCVITQNVKLKWVIICFSITAVCLLFLIKLKWPKNKSIYDEE